MDTSPHYVILNSAVGGWWPGGPDVGEHFPQYHYIDYVRVYGWQPCVTGCGAHGCCDETSNTCACDSDYSGTFCEYANNPYGDSFQNSFTAKTADDTLTDNAAINHGLTITMATCTTCGSDPVKGGSWTSAGSLGTGNFTFVAKIPKVNGTGTLFTGTNGAGTYTGFQLSIANSDNVGIQTFGANPYTFHSFKMPFNVSSDYHTYTVAYGAVNFTFYADGQKIVDFPASNVPLRILPFPSLPSIGVSFAGLPGCSALRMSLQEDNFCQSCTMEFS
eukprot:Phypoly_transcript_09863.p1 GENE.Phypoly_transcript_09863~~Phypoly_transcript_09863.p1  ORF type:complete len:289 (+),score=30.90 Phypoly_transcript_09863:45-869(+)